MVPTWGPSPLHALGVCLAQALPFHPTTANTETWGPGEGQGLLPVFTAALKILAE